MNRILPLAALALALSTGSALAQGTTAPAGTTNGTATGTTNGTVAATAAPSPSLPTTTGSSDYGWIGLLGLAGLAGLIPRRTAVTPTYTSTTSRT